MTTGGIILCGGKSTRMGRDKATLPFGPELMLERILRLLSEVVDPSKLVVAGAPGQQLPPLPPLVIVSRDEHPERGPLAGIAAGLAALPADIDAAYITSCDVPLLVPAFAARMFELLGDHDIAVPIEKDQLHPLAAVYRASVLTHARRFIAADRLRLRSLFDEVKTRFVPVEELRSVDPDLKTLLNLNDEDDYQAALRHIGA